PEAAIGRPPPTRPLRDGPAAGAPGRDRRQIPLYPPRAGAARPRHRRRDGDLRRPDADEGLAIGWRWSYGDLRRKSPGSRRHVCAAMSYIPHGGDASPIRARGAVGILAIRRTEDQPKEERRC